MEKYINATPVFRFWKFHAKMKLSSVKICKIIIEMPNLSTEIAVTNSKQAAKIFSKTAIFITIFSMLHW